MVLESNIDFRKRYIFSEAFKEAEICDEKMVALPLFKLGILVVKQVSKPIANLVKTGAKNSRILRGAILFPAQIEYLLLVIMLKLI